MRRLCDLFVRMLPADLRATHGDEIRRDVERRWREGRRVSTLADLAASVVRERRRDRSPRPSPGRRPAVMSHVFQDLRFALRMLRRQPGFTLATTLTLGLGIGSAAAIVSLADATLLRPVAARQPHQLVEVPFSMSYPDFREMQKGVDGFAGVTGYSNLAGVSLQRAGVTQRVPATMVGGNFFDLLGVAPHAGRLLTPSDDTGSTIPAVVVSHRLWRAAFDESPALIGETVLINEKPVVIVGVAPPDFRGLSLGNVGDVWMPIGSINHVGTGFLSGMGAFAPSVSWVKVVARMSHGETPAQASARLDRWYLERHPPLASADRDPLVVDTIGSIAVGRGAAAPLKRFLLLLFAVAAVLLVLGCANVANLLLARAAVRRQEVGVRIALGAGRGRLVSQLLTESAVIALAGAAAGVAIAAGGLKLIGQYRLPGELPIADLGLRLNGVVVGAAILLACVAVLIFGLVPALLTTRRDINLVLRSDSRGASRMPIGRALVVVQVALCVAMVGAGLLFARGLQRGLGFDLGYQPRGAVMVSSDPTLVRYTSRQAEVFTADVLARLRAEPWVASAGAAFLRPMRGAMTTHVVIEGARQDADEDYDVNANFVTDGWFEALGVRVLEGRTFVEADRTAPAKVAVVNRTLARKYWPGGSAVGRRIRFGDGPKDPFFEIVGVVADARYGAVDAEVTPFVYQPMLQQGGTRFRGQVHFFARTAAGPDGGVAALQGVLQSTDKRVPIFGAMTLEEHVAAALMPQRLGLMLTVTFAVAALILASAGVYAIAACTVSARRREIGIRMALGADRGQVLREILRHGTLPVLAGAASGLVIQLWASKLAESFVFGLTAKAPAQLALAAGLVIGAALLALAIPARRAARIDPSVALRES